MSYNDITDEQRDRYNASHRESRRETRRRLAAQNAAIQAALEEARQRRLVVRPDAFGKTEDETVRTFTREALYGEQQTARYRGTGFYAGRRA